MTGLLATANGFALPPGGIGSLPPSSFFKYNWQSSSLYSGSCMFRLIILSRCSGPANSKTGSFSSAAMIDGRGWSMACSNLSRCAYSDLITLCSSPKRSLSSLSVIPLSPLTELSLSSLRRDRNCSENESSLTLRLLACAAKSQSLRSLFVNSRNFIDSNFSLLRIGSGCFFSNGRLLINQLLYHCSDKISYFISLNSSPALSPVRST